MEKISYEDLLRQKAGAGLGVVILESELALSMATFMENMRKRVHELEWDPATTAPEYILDKLHDTEMSINKQLRSCSAEIAFEIRRLMHKQGGETERIEQIQWIPCRERLPIKSETYLVTYEWTGLSGTKYKEVGPMDFQHGRWSCHSNVTITAWMPLPKPFTADTPQSVENNGDIIVRSNLEPFRVADTPQTERNCFTCKHDGTGDVECMDCDHDYSGYEPKQTERSSDDTF